MKKLKNFLDHLSKNKSNSEYVSQFGGMWIDQVNSATKNAKLAKIAKTNGAIAEQISCFDKYGYVILRDAIPHKTCDSISRALEDAYENGSASINAQFPGEHGVKRAIKAGDSYKSARMIDTYMVLSEALAALFNEEIKDFLMTVFEEEPLLFQSLNFFEGSGQGLHQDTAFVVTNEPMKLIASWIALEDVVQGSGELNFVPGSHRYNEYLFSSKYKHFSAERDGKNSLQQFYKHIDNEIEINNGQLDQFLAKKGDVLLWHADLYHGGAPVRIENSTRKSLVGHYCPLSAKPNFFNFANNTIHQINSNNFASAYYEEVCHSSLDEQYSG